MLFLKNKMKIIINEENNGKRVDLALSELSDFSRSMIQKIIINKKLLCNEEIVLKANKTTKTGEEYFLEPIESNFTKITPEKYDLEILFEDQYLIIVNKPAELIIHPGAGNFNNTLVNKLAYHCSLSDINGPEKLGTVHRLDKGVSGCIIFAKDNITHANINDQFASRTIKKTYYAISHGTTNSEKHYLENYISRSKINRKKMAISEKEGKLAQMYFKIKKTIQHNDKNLSLIECNPITGRMHQIRLQLSKFKLPIVNDCLYGIKECPSMKTLFYKRMGLHAKNITLMHPKTKIEMKIESPFPKEFTDLFEIL
ncbi:RluA family pseudouridine synthase [Alphaproteobacteria bacterium endosymbiont of Tiliacea citrago]|uniref:RluA family pseudouridine synthase n=1 Tax=Alphaproteobacteria bacterium endosymbiont of Tiliacea citrago TaxID=3077944 RepID=UPI00313ACD9B